MNQLGLVQAVDGLGQSVAAHRRLYASLGQAFGVPNADVLRAPVRVVNQAAVALGLEHVVLGFNRSMQHVREHVEK